MKMRFIGLSLGLLFVHCGVAQDIPCCCTGVAFTADSEGCTSIDQAFYLNGEFLYWKIQEDKLIFAREDAGKTDPDAPPTSNTIVEQNFKYNPGFRVGVGYRIPYDGWYISADWTRLSSHTSTSLSEPNFGVIAVLPSGDREASFASSKWNVKFNALDVEIGRGNLLSCRFSLKPFAGLKAAWITQHWDVQYVGYDPAAAAAGTSDTFLCKSDYKAVGPRIGTDARWHLGSQFGLFGSIAGSLLYGKFNATTRNIITPLGINIPIILNNYRIRPALESKIGLDWGTCFSNCYYAYIGIAYELQFWWDQNQMPIPFRIDPEGALQLQGLTADLRFDF